jgi:hypothetical protein
MNNFYNHKVNRNNVQLHGLKLYYNQNNSSSGGDVNNQPSSNGLPSNIPNNPRHRQYMGLQNRGCSILPPSL